MRIENNSINRFAGVDTLRIIYVFAGMVAHSFCK